MTRRTIAQHLTSHAVSVGDLSTDPANVRIHDAKSIAAIKASLARFGQQKPIVVDEAGVVVAGNGTLEAARQLGWEKVAAVRTRLTGTERIAYSIADNRTGELSTWDTPSLHRLLASMDSDLAAAAGYDAEEIAGLLEEDAKQLLDDAPMAVMPEAVTHPGDLWILGEHRLLCGDSTNPADVDRVMEGAKASIVQTDPPYLVDYTGERMGNHGKDWSNVYREVEIKDASGFFDALFGNVVRVMAPHAAIYCWHASSRVPEIRAVWEKHGILCHQTIIWVKPTMIIGRMFWQFRHEPCLMGWSKGSMPHHDGMHEPEGTVWAGGKERLEDLTKEQLLAMVKASSDAWEVPFDGDKLRSVGNEHPTQKPIELFARPLRKHTRRGDVCFEPFSGSGTQIMACEQLGRACRAIELEPRFVDLAIRRWQELTGTSARLGAPTGRTWAQTAKARGVEVQCPSSPKAPVSTEDAPGSPPRATARSTGPKLRKPKPGKAQKEAPPAAAMARRGGG